MITMKLETGIGEKLHALLQHYNHARRKHPHFADRLFILGHGSHLELNERLLEKERQFIQSQIDAGCVSAESILSCELREAAVEVSRRDWKLAVEELYDSAAVILRMIDMIETIQKKEF